MGSSPAPSQGSVLIVDDDRDIADFIQEALAEEGYVVSVLRNCRSDELRAAVDATEPDCVLLDGGHGSAYGASWDDAAWLATRPRPVAVIMFTAHMGAIREAQERASRRSQAARFVSILTKPFELEDLILQVQTAVGKRFTPDE